MIQEENYDKLAFLGGAGIDCLPGDRWILERVHQEGSFCTVACADFSACDLADTTDYDIYNRKDLYSGIVAGDMQRNVFEWKVQ